MVDLARIASQSLKNICTQRRAELEAVHKLHVMWHPVRLRPHDYPQRHAGLAQQAILLRHQARWALIVPNGTQTDTVGDALQSLKISHPQWMAQHAKDPAVLRATAFNLLAFEARQRPSGMTVRPPARAGTFYPEKPDDLRAAVDRHLKAGNGAQRQPCRAVMLPHAGWRFCGDIIGKTLARVDVPDLVLILGPKHTPSGPRWSVPPHQRWEFPGGGVAIDTDVVHRLIELVPGLQCEPLAHQQEHGAEVLLPFLHRINPNVRVVPVVLGMTGLDALAPVAEALAQITREQTRRPPLLVISSDLNHYAAEPENRRLDQLALQAMTGGDPEALYRTCIQHHISMCGVLPACAVMEALRQATPTLRPHVVDYTNSAAVTGDATRVVGYAGVTIA
jgi:AmmeMemoRadiSam system protein B